MKKIKEYILKHPKLKRTLKILAVIGVIFSVGFNILIIGVGSCANTNRTNVATTPIVANRSKPTRKDFGRFDYGNGFKAYLFESDLRSQNFAKVFFESIANSSSYYADMSPYNTNLINVTWEYSSSSPSTTLGGSLFDVYESNISSTNFRIGYYHVNKVSSVYTNSDPVVIKTNYQIIISNPNDEAFITINYQVLSDLLDVASNSMGLQLVKSSITYGFNNSNWFSWCIEENTNDTIITPFITHYINRLDTTDYYNLGYNNGYSTGYNNGYNNGYSGGLSDRDGSPFGLIQSAFSSLIQILNINLLPGISLASVIFTPLIITIIIVIVKMFRG